MVFLEIVTWVPNVFFVCVRVQMLFVVCLFNPFCVCVCVFCAFVFVFWCLDGCLVFGFFSTGTQKWIYTTKGEMFLLVMFSFFISLDW